MANNPNPKLTAPGEGRSVSLYGVRFTYKVDSADTGGRLALLEVEVPPRTLVKPRGTPHALWNTDSAPATVLEILSPGGLEGYFEELAPILDRHGGDAPQQFYDLASGYGITIHDDWIEELERTYGVRL